MHRVETLGITAEMLNSDEFDSGRAGRGLTIADDNRAHDSAYPQRDNAAPARANPA